MTELKIEIPDQVFQALQIEATQRGEAIDTLIVHYLSLIKTLLIDKASVSTQWPTDFFENTAGSWSGEPLKRSPQGDYAERLEL